MTDKTLEQRITERLHQSLGDLITDADLKGMVERGVEQTLFQERRITNDRGYHDRTLPPLMQEVAEKLLKARMEAAVDVWLKENPERVEAIVKQVIQAGMSEAFMATLDNRFKQVFEFNLVPAMQQRGLLR